MFGILLSAVFFYFTVCRILLPRSYPELCYAISLFSFIIYICKSIFQKRKSYLKNLEEATEMITIMVFSNEPFCNINKLYKEEMVFLLNL